MLNSSFTKLFTAATVLSTALARPSSNPALGQADLPLREVAQLGDADSWFEGVVSLANGNLLISMLSPSPSVYTIKNPNAVNATLSPVYTFDGVVGLIGIAETSPDTVVVAALAGLGPGSMTLWELYISGETLVARKITDIPEAELLNGVASVPSCKPAVLVADCSAGVVFRVEVSTGEYTIVLDVPETKRGPDSGASKYGVNGIKIHEGYLYWSNSDLYTIYRIRVDEEGFPVEGAPVEKYASVSDVTFLDDFAIDSKGTIWAATHNNNSLIAIEFGGMQTTIPGGSSEQTILGNTAAAFGRTSKDREVLYVVTGQPDNMGSANPEPAKVVAIDTRHFYDGDVS